MKNFMPKKLTNREYEITLKVLYSLFQDVAKRLALKNLIQELDRQDKDQRRKAKKVIKRRK